MTAYDAVSSGWLEAAWQNPHAAFDNFEGVSPYHLRLMRAWSQRRAGGCLSGKDLAPLLRSVAITQARAGQHRPKLPPEVIELLPRGALVESSLGLAAGVLSASVWTPSWLFGRDGVHSPLDDLYELPIRRTDERAPGDPPLWQLGLQTYHSQAQREAVRTVLTAPAGSTVVINLPTGSGKSLCALLPALQPLPDESDRLGVTPIVVPVVALALDLEQRAQHLVGHRTAYRPDDESAREIALRARAGVQGPVFLSPECLVGSFADPLREAAKKGLLRHFVVDEAHMVSAWGDDFRPAFQQVAALRHELLQLCPREPFTTVLMSATLTEYSLDSLNQLYSVPGPIHHVHAVRLRPEPAYWSCRAPDEATRVRWVDEIVDHVPRPLILYTTRRTDVVNTYRRLLRRGYTRIRCMHGGSTEDERRDLLAAWNQDLIDIVVANSAFGLGVDKQDVRSVVHASCPEDIDRFYQDVGRGGRDGRASLSILVWTDQDARIAKRLAVPTFIGIERGLERWSAMFSAKQVVDASPHSYLVPLDVVPSGRSGDIDMDNDENQRWNLRTLLLMQRAAILQIEGGGSTTDLGCDYRRVRVRILDQSHLDEDTWAERVEPLRNALVGQSREGWHLLQEVRAAKKCVSHVLQRAYESNKYGVAVTRACGGCQACRTAGHGARCPRMYARHAPATPWAPAPLSPALTRFFGGERLVTLFCAATDSVLHGKLKEFAVWFCKQGGVNLVVPPEWLETWQLALRGVGARSVFLFAERPTGVTRGQPTVAILLGSLTSTWADWSESLRELPGATVLVLPGDLCEPDRRDRRVVDTLRWPRRMSLGQWEEWYLE